MRNLLAFETSSFYFLQTLRLLHYVQIFLFRFFILQTVHVLKDFMILVFRALSALNVTQIVLRVSEEVKMNAMNVKRETISMERAVKPVIHLAQDVMGRI